MSSTIDAHHHFWKYDPAEYAWIGPNMLKLRRDFLPPDLHAEIRAAGVDGVVSVQARQTLAETNWLLDLADRNSFIRGVVGWAPMIDPNIEKILEGLAHRRKLAAIRHVLQDETDDRYMLRPDFDRGIGALKHFDLRYDILIYERQLPAAIEMVDRHPEQIFVVDHIAKPKIAKKEIEPWRTNILALAKRRNVYCKLSGMVTEADWTTWSAAQLQPYIDAVLEAFGPQRLMFGSDWPVCLAATTYSRWVETVREATKKLSQAEQNRIWGETAADAYGLDRRG